MPDGVHLDVFHVINIDEFFVNIGAIGTRMAERRIDLAGLVSDLERNEFNVTKGESVHEPCGTGGVRVHPENRCRRCGLLH